MKEILENILLRFGILPTIDPRDNHEKHIKRHNKLHRNVAIAAHNHTHSELLLYMKDHPELL